MVQFYFYKTSFHIFFPTSKLPVATENHPSSTTSSIERRRRNFLLPAEPLDFLTIFYANKLHLPNIIPVNSKLRIVAARTVYLMEFQLLINREFRCLLHAKAEYACPKKQTSIERRKSLKFYFVELKLLNLLYFSRPNQKL